MAPPRRPLSQPTPLTPLSEGKSCFYTYFHLSAILLGRTAYENRACEGALEPLATDSPDCPLLLHAPVQPPRQCRPPFTS